MTPYEAKSSETEGLPESLKRLLQNSNLSLVQLSEALGLPIMTIRRLITGETTDPRISTLRLFADYFKVTVDALLNNDEQLLNNQPKTVNPHFVPLLDWSTAGKVNSISNLDLAQWPDWQPISVEHGFSIGKNAFALESRPSMHPRFPQGTIFIIDPDLSPKDGDIVLIKIKEQHELTLRELSIDAPDWRLLPIVSGSSNLAYSEKIHEIVGINFLTLLYNRR